MTTIQAPQTPSTSSTGNYVNPAFSTDSLEDEGSSSSVSSSPSPRRYTFTPRRVTKLPRAWERKLATPFAPRTDGQRIWKRVPLGETQTSSRPTNIGEKHHDAELKTVKRLRTDVEEKENAVYLSTKWDDAQEIVRRKVSQTVGHSLEKEQNDYTFLDHLVEEANPGIEMAFKGNGEQEGSNVLTLPDQQVDMPPSAEGIDESLASEYSPAFEKSPASTAINPVKAALPDKVSDVSDIQMDPSRETGDPMEIMDTTEDKGEIPRQEQATIMGWISAECTEEVQIQAADLPSTATVTSKSPQGRRRRSSLAALFTGSGLVQLPQPEHEPATTSTTEPAKQPTSVAHDDTAFLHEFLTRARAQKAAKASCSPEKLPTIASSPTKRSCQALATFSANSTSPSKTKKIQLQPDMMPEENGEATASSPCRRSNRTRLPVPQKAITTIPSNIPMRRSNGTEFIFLQRTEAQEIALATRANTKRNKGDAMPPKVKLPYTNNAQTPSPIKSPRKGKAGKEVSWAKQLAQFREEALGEPVEIERKPEGQETSSMDSKPKARKMKRLGTVNGTPAPKRTMMDEPEMESHIPTRKLRSRVKS